MLNEWKDCRKQEGRSISMITGIPTATELDLRSPSSTWKPNVKRKSSHPSSPEQCPPTQSLRAGTSEHQQARTGRVHHRQDNRNRKASEHLYQSKSEETTKLTTLKAKSTQYPSIPPDYELEEGEIWQDPKDPLLYAYLICKEYPRMLVNYAWQTEVM